MNDTYQPEGEVAARPLLSWQIGHVKVTRVPEYAWPTPIEFFPDASVDALFEVPWLFPDFVTPEGLMRFSCHALLLEAPGVRVIVDTCFGENKGLSLDQYEKQGEFLATMASAGFTRENVDLVLCTHLHIDHVGWNTMIEQGRWVPTFPNARYLIAAEEFRYTTSEDEHLARCGADMVIRDSVQPIVDANLVDLVAGDHRLSPELRLVPTPGHTPGHVSVYIESEGEWGVVTGDMMHHPCQIAYPTWTNDFDTDRGLTAATREMMLNQWEGTGALIIGTHFVAPTAGVIIREDGRRKFETRNNRRVSST